MATSPGRTEIDWIITHPDVDFSTLMSGFDTALTGRCSFEAVQRHGGWTMPGIKVVVVSRTLRQDDHPDITVVNGPLAEAVRRLCSESGKDIWLFGGGSLFRSVLDARLVDTIEVAVIPILLGAGTRMLSPPGDRANLR